MHNVISNGRLPQYIMTFMIFISLVVTLNASAYSTISCHQNINISLDDDCESQLSANDILTVPPHPAEPHDLILTDENGVEIIDDIVRETHLWTTITAKVVNTVTGNSCWGTINVEDKNPPTIECTSVTISCIDAGDYLPSHSDNCTTSTLELVSESTIPNSCGPTIIKVIEREWRAVDGYGNRSPSCMQTISLERLDFGAIEFPESLQVDMMTNLTCESVVFDENGFPSVDSTGVPTIDGMPLYPIQGIYCNIGVDYEDLLISDQSCVQKYMRTWRVAEAMCTGAGNFVQVPQTIEIADSELPTITCPEPRIISTSGAACEATTVLELPSFTDDCSGTVELDISYSGPFLNDVKTPPTVVLGFGVNEIEYTIYDACENPATCITTVTVMDDTAPIANCDDSKVVSLRSSGTAYAPVESFDNGSTDDCAFYKSIIRKDSNTCDCVEPEFDDMTFIGEREGKYYYISTIERYAFEAFGYSNAFGGSIVIPETEEEFDWLLDAVRNETNDDFLIGLIDKNDDGYFTWNDHAIPVYDRWAVSEPSDIGQNVIVNEDGNWEVFDGTMNRAFFVTEFEGKCGFSEFVHFCCVDAMEDPTLTVRAIDRFGRFNDCTITVEIQDKVAPVISCPSDLTFDCDKDFDFSNLDIYGVASATDECLNDDITSIYEENISSCGVGEIVRTFTASDPTGSSTCQQVISVGENKPTGSASVTWPEDFTTVDGCNSGDLLPENLPAPNGFPTFTSADCSLLEVSYSDQTFSFTASGSDACLKILRTWTVTDSCLLGTTGYTPQSIQQTIKVINNEGPEITSGCDDVVIQTDNCVDAPLAILVTATDDCTSPENIRGRIQIDENSDGVGMFDREVDGFDAAVFLEHTYPIGEHFAIIEFTDECGNANSCTKRITVENNIPPVAACVSGLTSMIQDMDTNGDGNVDSQMTMLFASMLDRANASTMTSGSFHPCGFQTQFSFSSDLNDTVAVYNCDHVGLNNTLTLWVTDEFGNTHTCNTIIDIQDDEDRCNGGINMVEVRGEILTEKSEPIENVSVKLEGSDTPVIMTDSEGEFAFSEMPVGGYYSVVPELNDNPLNGVSTLDLVMIQRHILGLTKLNTPYKMIAADVDKSGSITAIDMIELRKLILGINSEFQNNDSWRIIDGQFDFVDGDPFTTSFPESYDIFELNSDVSLDFIGVKVGDVDNSVALQESKGIVVRSSENDVILSLEERQLQAHRSYPIKFRLKDISNLDGFQLALNIDTDLVEVVGFVPHIDDLSIANINQHGLSKGDIRISWNTLDFEVKDDVVLFEIMVRPKSEIYTSDAINLKYDNLLPEIYTNGEAQPLRLSYEMIDASSDEIKLYQNVPNPWSDITQIKFYTPEESSYKFNLFDVNGKVIYRQLNQSTKGVNIIEIDKSMVGQAGVLFYEVLIGDVRLMNKMILLN